MKYLLGLILLISVSASAQYSPTAAKTRFVNGIGLGTKDTLSMNAADTVAMIVGRDSLVYFRYKGYWKPLAYNSSLTGYVPYTGATGSVNLGSYNLTANKIAIGGSISAVALDVHRAGSIVARIENTNSSQDALFAYAQSAQNVWFTGIDYASGANNFGFYYTPDGTTVIRKAYFSNSGDLTANSFIKSGGTSSQFLKADGSVTTIIPSGSIDTGRAVTAIATGGSLNKVRDSLSSVVSSGYIPYTGATGAVNLGAYSITASSFIGGGSGLTSLPTNTALYPILNQNTTGNAASASTITINDNTTTSAEYFPVWTPNTGTSKDLYVSSTKLKFNPLDGVLSVFGNGINTSGHIEATYGIFSSGTTYINATTTIPSVSNAKLIVKSSSADFCVGIQANTATGNSYGPFIQAGSNSSDISLLIRDITNTNDYFKILGSGVISTYSRLNVNGATDDGSTALNVTGGGKFTSTTQGFLMPRMTATQRAAITSPAEGLLVIQTDGTMGLYLYINSGWHAIIML